MLTRHLLISLGASCFFLHCSSSPSDNDGGTDASGDSPVAQDGGKDAAALDAAKDVALDTTVVDAPADSPSDSTVDSTVDAPADSPEDATADASSDVSVDGGSVSSISGLVLWLDAAKGVTTSGSDITAWADQSSKGNDASGGTATPTLVSSSINGLPAAHFDAGSTQYVSIADAASLQWGTGDFYVAVVAKFDNDPNDGASAGIGAFYAKLGPSSGLLFFANDFNLGAQTVVAGLSNVEDPTPTEIEYAASYNDGAARLYVLERVSGTEALRVNGSQVVTSASSIDVTESGHDVFVGLMEQGDAALDGDIAELIAVQGSLSSGDRSTIETYLQTKYGL